MKKHFTDGENNSFAYAILFALRFNVSDKIDVCDEKEIQETIEDQLFLKLFENRGRFQLGVDNKKFNLYCTLKLMKPWPIPATS